MRGVTIMRATCGRVLRDESRAPIGAISFGPIPRQFQVDSQLCARANFDLIRMSLVTPQRRH